MTKTQAVNKVLNIARSEIGYHEKSSIANLDDKTKNSGSGNYTKYARDLERVTGFYNGAKNGFAWCDVFYDWLLYTAFGADTAKKLLCQPDYSAGAGCLYSAQYYKQSGRWRTTPDAGDQIFFTYSAGEVSHTGIVEAVSGSTVTTIEGNTSDGVYRRQYGINNSQIYGYGRPDWTIVFNVEEDATGENEKPSVETPTSVKKYSLSFPVLVNGDESELVKTVQVLLIAQGHYCGGRIINRVEIPDGEFGQSTENAVKLFQSANGLTKSGKVDKATMKYLLMRG